MNEDMNNEEVVLPEISGDRIHRIEQSLFAAIDAENDASARRTAASRLVRRRRMWLGTGAAAAVIVVAAVIAPSLPNLLGGAASNSAASEGAPEHAPEIAPGRDLSGASMTDGGTGTAEQSTVDGAEREIIATASASVRVDDVAEAAEAIAQRAEANGGYVEAMSIGDEQPIPFDSGAEYGDGGVVTYQSGNAGAWITVRVPAADLAQATAALTELGEVTASQIDRRDVTSEAVDLRARVEALGASVERLTVLVSEAESTADLIAAEEALASRQSDLEAYEQQLKYLDDQVGMSSLTVSLSEPQPVVQADPAGFGDGVSAGWNGLVAALNGFVVALGFLLPWLGVIAVVVLVVWAIRRTTRARTERRHALAESGREVE